MSQWFLWLLIAGNVIFSLQAFGRPEMIQAYSFSIHGIRAKKQYYRLLTSAFLHVNFMHLFFNMFALWSFGQALAPAFGGLGFFLLYFISLLAGDGLALITQRNNPQYTAVGASGAVSGVIFAFVLLAPNAQLAVFFIPMPAWIFSIFYIAVSIFGMRNQLGNIGHEAHLGGAIAGLAICALFFPEMLIKNAWVLALTAVPAALLFMVPSQQKKKTPIKRWDNGTENLKKEDQQFYQNRLKRRERAEKLLQKAKTKGSESLTEAEERFLRQFMAEEDE